MASTGADGMGLPSGGPISFSISDALYCGLADILYRGKCGELVPNSSPFGWEMLFKLVK